jgi:hypothetical protein
VEAEKEAQVNTPAKEACLEKDRHASEADAYAAASRRVGNGHDKPAALRAYLCPECNGWHLTKQVEPENLTPAIRLLSA